MRRALIWTLTSVALVFMAAGIMVRAVPSDAARWHVDPLTAPATGRPNAWRVGPEDQSAVPVDAPAKSYAADPRTLARAFDEFALAQPRVERLAGGPDEGWTTYVQRSRVFGFPDYVSVRFLSDGGDRSTVAAFSRARFGRSDLGVNRARLETWLAALDRFAS